MRGASARLGDYYARTMLPSGVAIIEFPGNFGIHLLAARDRAVAANRSVFGTSPATQPRAASTMCHGWHVHPSLRILLHSGCCAGERRWRFDALLVSRTCDSGACESCLWAAALAAAARVSVSGERPGREHRLPGGTHEAFWGLVAGGDAVWRSWPVISVTEGRLVREGFCVFGLRRIPSSPGARSPVSFRKPSGSPTA